MSVRFAPRPRETRGHVEDTVGAGGVSQQNDTQGQQPEPPVEVAQMVSASPGVGSSQTSVRLEYSMGARPQEVAFDPETIE